MIYTGLPVPQYKDGATEQNIRALYGVISQLNELLSVYLNSIDGDITKIRETPQTVCCAEYALMLMVLHGGLSEEAGEYLTNDAFGLTNRGYKPTNIGECLYRVCSTNPERGLPSPRFRAKRTFGELLNDHTTRDEIANLPLVLSLINSSTDTAKMYRNSFRDDES